MSSTASPKNLTVDWKAVGRRIRELRGFDTKQSELADAVGVAQSYVSAIERGEKEPGAVILFRISKLYGKSIEWLLTGNDLGGR
jgi:transcriptional regulator with XRE-family HTH domain